MYKLCNSVLIILLLAFNFPIPVNAADITKIDYLVNNMEQFDGKLVTIEAEAIGESMNRGNYSWINVADGTNAIGIWLKSSDAAKITNFGDYKHIGDTVQIVGMFSRNSLTNGGEVEIDCSSFKIVQKGYTLQEQVQTRKIFMATLLFSVALMLSYFHFRKIKNRKIYDL